jgi:hypothetical protein
LVVDGHIVDWLDKKGRPFPADGQCDGTYIMSVKSQPMRIILDSWMSPLLSRMSLAMSKTMPVCVCVCVCARQSKKGQ